MTKNLAAVYYQMSRWYQQPLGKTIAGMEQQLLNQVITSRFGYHLLYLGFQDDVNLDASPINHHIIQSPGIHSLTSTSNVFATYDEMPYRESSIDVAVIAHVLEFMNNPESILRELQRVLIPEGYLIIFYFNRYSLLGLWREFRAKCHDVPWVGRFFRNGQVTNWLQQQDFEVIAKETIFYRPPFAYNKILDKFLFLEKVGKNIFPMYGGITMLVAQKKILGVTPLRPAWQKKQLGLANGFEPTTRNSEL